MPTPTRIPSVCAIARKPPTSPRRETGTWSGTAAVTAAYIALMAICAPHHATTMTPTLGATARTSSDAAPPAAPPSTHGSRRPTRNVVRSENAPKTGLLIVDTIAPARSTSDSTPSLWSGESSRACSARSTWIGPNQPEKIARFTRVRAATQRAGGVRVGSSSADGRPRAVRDPAVDACGHRHIMGGLDSGSPSETLGGELLVGLDALQQEDRDLPVGLRLVRRVRAVLRDRPLPPLRALRRPRRGGPGRGAARGRPAAGRRGGRGSCSTRRGVWARRPSRQRRRTRRPSPRA